MLIDRDILDDGVRDVLLEMIGETVNDTVEEAELVGMVLTDQELDVVVLTDMDLLLAEDGDSDVLELTVLESMLDRVVLSRRVRVGDGTRECEPVDETLRKKVLVADLVGVVVCDGRNSTVKLWDALTENVEVVEGVTLWELVGVIDSEAESEVDAEDVSVDDNEDDMVLLTVMDMEADLSIDGDVLGD